MKRSTRVISIFLATTMTFTALSACSLFKNKDDGINRVTIILPDPSEAEEIVNVTAAVTINSYLTARAYFDLILDYDTENMSESEAEEFVKLIDDATVMFENTELLSAELVDAVDAWEDSGAEREEAEIKELAISPLKALSFSQDVYAAKKSPAEEWAQDIVSTYDNAQPGKGLKTLAEQMGTDAKHAYEQLKQAQAILEGQAYTEVADKAGQIVTGLKTMKAAGAAASFVIAVSAAPASVGLVETGGILCTGVNAMAQIGSLGSEIICGTEDNYVSATFDKLDDKASKLGTVFGFIGLGGAVTDIGKTGKQILSNGWNSLSDSAKESFINNTLGVVSLGSSELTNYLDDGSLIGGAFKVTSKGTEFTLLDTVTGKKDKDVERAKDLLSETGLGKADIKQIAEEKGYDDLNDSLPKDVAEQIIKDNEPLTPEGGFDVNTFVEGVAEEIGKEPATSTLETEPSETEPEITETEPTASETVPTESETEPTVITETTVETTADSASGYDTMELYYVDEWMVFLEGSWYGEVPSFVAADAGVASEGDSVVGSWDLKNLILTYSGTQETLSDQRLLVYYVNGDYFFIQRIDGNTIVINDTMPSAETTFSYTLVRE
ncbi:MAG: hypothetical protein J5776_07395 [Clostridiales bacterium]|nr:hypothetical protein [Clostridiales bacterium]